VKIIWSEIFSQERVLIIMAPQEAQLQAPAGLDGKTFAALLAWIAREEWEWKSGETALVAFADAPVRIVLGGLGEADKLTARRLRKAVGKAVRKARENKSGTAGLWLNSIPACAEVTDLPALVAETAVLADYSFDKYLTEKDKNHLESLTLLGKVNPATVEEAVTLALATCYTRDLVNEPANALLPADLAAKAHEAGQSHGFAVQVFDEKAIVNELKMEAYWSVARGSDNPPRLIVMRWQGDPGHPQDITALVGKGLTYDSGGYAIKNPVGMSTMKCDMGGAGAVIGAMCAIAKAGLKINVTGVVAACENMISGKAYRNGDIIGSMAGKTIEVINTDAEGRLTLIDAITYAIDREKAGRVVDIATLTGAVVVALSDVRMGVVSNDEALGALLEKASLEADEPFWRMPHDDDYKEQLKSKVADLRNTGSSGAGTVTAGLFIRDFVQEKPWLHLDIAGTAYVDKPGAYWPEGATGSGARLLYRLVKQLAL